MSILIYITIDILLSTQPSWLIYLDCSLSNHHFKHSISTCHFWLVTFNSSVLICHSWRVTLDMSLLTCHMYIVYYWLSFMTWYSWLVTLNDTLDLSLRCWLVTLDHPQDLTGPYRIYVNHLNGNLWIVTYGLADSIWWDLGEL